MSYRAIYFDGRSAKAHDAIISFDGERLTVMLADASLSFEPLAYDIAPIYADGRCHIDCSNGARLEVSDAEAREALRKKLAHHHQWFSMLTRRMSLVAVALLLSAATVYLLATEGTSLAAAGLSKVFPEKTERQIGETIIGSAELMNRLFQPAALPQERQHAIRQRLANLCEHDRACPRYRLHFRQSKHFGANAFALPGGDIIITDALVELAPNDDEIIAVLAHELGHVAHRHALRRMLESSLRALLLAGITGDVDSVASALPALMFDLRYSRALETDADRFSLAFLQRHCIPPDRFISIMQRLSTEDHEKSDRSVLLPTLMSTHPGLQERIAAFRTVGTGVCR